MPRPGPTGGQYCLLTQEEIQRVHEASVAVLERTGVHVEHETARDLFREGGARIDGARVYICRSRKLRRCHACATSPALHPGP